MLTACRGRLLTPFGLLLFLLPTTLFAQTLPLAGQEGVHRSLVPVLGYTSDAGLFGGAVYQRIDYAESIKPFDNRTALEFTLSTRGQLIANFDHERLRSFGTDIRSRYRLEAQRIGNQTFFGVGNRTEFGSSEFEEGLYNYIDRTIRIKYQGRKRLIQFGPGEQLEGQFMVTLSHSDPGFIDGETLLDATRPAGYQGGWVNLLGAGLVMERRDNEFDPARGYRLEASLEAAGRWSGSDYRFSRFRSEARGYLPVGDWLVIAQKLEARHTFGNTPFWELPSVGHELGLRGYALNRFRGRSSLFHIVELRSWLFTVLEDHIRLGGHLFMDTGRVFSDGDRLGDLPSGLKQTFGFGGTMSLFNPDFIFRGEVGFSDELYRIYIGVGYLF